jgi:integrase
MRYLRLEGVTELALDDAVLSVAGSNSSLPRGISSAAVTALLGSCDRRRPIGRRDYAILMLLCRLGLRGGEVVGLALDDIDWRAGEIVVAGKGGRRDRLPLAADVGAALGDSLRQDRPRVEDRAVFVRQFAPIRGLAGTGAIRSVLARACHRAGIPYANPHRLRHTLASEVPRTGSTGDLSNARSGTRRTARRLLHARQRRLYEHRVAPRSFQDRAPRAQKGEADVDRVLLMRVTVQEMEVGPPEPLCRGWFHTTACCVG